MDIWYEKTSMIWLPSDEKFDDNTFSRFNTV